MPYIVFIATQAPNYIQYIFDVTRHCCINIDFFPIEVKVVLFYKMLAQTAMLHLNTLFVSREEAIDENFAFDKILFIPRHTIVAGYYGFTLDVRVSVRPSYIRPSVFRFRMIIGVNINGF